MAPKLFIGSSVESLTIAYAMQVNLEHDADITVWPQGIFTLTNTALDSLLKSVNCFDFAAFVLGSDDEVTIRDQKQQAPRDNVVFELGLFIGRLGKERVFLVVPAGQKDLHLPTDLLGLMPATFNADREDKSLEAALGPACHKIRVAVKNVGQFPGTPPEPESLVKECSENDIISLLESWMGSRPADLNTQAIKYSDVDGELKLPQGSAEKYIEIAAQRWGYHRRRKGTLTILFEKPASGSDTSRRAELLRFR